MNPKLPNNIEIISEDVGAFNPEQFCNILANQLHIKTPAARIFLQHALENVLLMDAKQQDYGSANIRKGGTFGCLLRSSDKFERLFNLFNNRRKRAVNESILDSFRDISNYMIIAIMLEKGQWPKD